MTFPNLEPLNVFLVSLTVLGGTLAGIWKWMNTFKKDMIIANSATMQRMIRVALERQSYKTAAEDYYTMEIEFDGGHKMAVPMFYGHRMLVSENVEMAVQDHAREYTELGLWCHGFGTLPRHRHLEACETIHVERGTITHYESGRIYRAGETWSIEPGDWHSAIFHDCYCRVIHRPPLLTAAVRPVDLTAMPKVFPNRHPVTA